VSYIEAHVPDVAWGSPDAVRDWVAMWKEKA
jgi:hypothetical protein